MSSVFSVCCLFWCGNLAAQADTAPGAGNGSPGQTGEVQLTYQDYTNLIAGKKITDDILAKSVNPQGWLEYTEDMDTDLAAVRTEKA